MNTQSSNQPGMPGAAEQRTVSGMRQPPGPSITPVTSAEMERENARLRLALREAHHRSGNQWQQLLGLAELERMQPQDECAGCARRVMMSAFAMLNQTLNIGGDVRTGSQTVGIRDALESILVQLQATTDEDSLAFAVQDAWLSEKGCAALLLICAELVCNAIRYGRKKTQVVFHVQGALGILEVRDDGPGFLEGFRVEEQSRQGLLLVEALCRCDLNGEMRCHNSTQGGLVSLIFPLLSAPKTALAAQTSENFCGMEGIICPPDTA